MKRSTRDRTEGKLRAGKGKALIGYAPDARWSSYATVIESALHSF
jgi:hypothetical protein